MNVSKKTKIITLYLTPQFVEVLDEKRQNYSRSSFIENTLLNALEVKMDNELS
jgi:hypothetical protein